MPILIKPQKLRGTIDSIPAKGDAHRKLICAALADKPTLLSPTPQGEDVAATIACLQELGANIIINGAGLSIRPIDNIGPAPRLNCRESASTLRFLLPLAALLTKDARFEAEGRLPQRPLQELLHALAEGGASFSGPELPFTVGGSLRGGLYTLAGNISSQYISGLLLALPLAQEDSQIKLTTALEAPGYVDMTINTQRKFGVNLIREGQSYFIPGRQQYISPGSISLEGDWSNAAVFLAAGALAGPIRLQGLDLHSPQGDKRIIELLSAFGAKVMPEESSITVSPGELRGQDINIADIPDLGPVLAVIGALSSGRTRLYNGARLRMKESDRLFSVAALLSRLGGRVLEGSDYLEIEGQSMLRGGVVKAMNDHRLVMAAALGAVACHEEVIIHGAQAVNKSYPDFFRDYNSLGGKSYDVHLG